MSNEKLLGIFDRVTQKIVADLEQGVRPWQKPWNGSHAGMRIVRLRRHNGEAYSPAAAIDKAAQDSSKYEKITAIALQPQSVS